MNDDAQQPAPGSTGATPSPKNHRGSNANATAAQRTSDKLFASDTGQKEITSSEVAVGGEL
jgi:hypothetical protein